jgi:hypothetical protein
LAAKIAKNTKKSRFKKASPACFEDWFFAFSAFSAIFVADWPSPSLPKALQEVVVESVRSAVIL